MRNCENDTFCFQNASYFKVHTSPIHHVDNRKRSIKVDSTLGQFWKYIFPADSKEKMHQRINYRR